MNFKHLKLAAVALLVSVGFSACDDEEEIVNWQEQVTGAYVINQGNQYGGVAGTISGIDFTSFSVSDGLFFAANNQSLGDTPQKGIHYGSKIYVPVYGSNLLWVLDAATLKIITSVETNEPEAVCGYGPYVYVSNNDGYVTRIDTTYYAGRGQIAVGPNPCDMTVATDGKLYVSISDGYNYASNYANGKKLAVVNTFNFNVEKEIGVGLNPGSITADESGNVYVVARGDYYSVDPVVQKVSANGTVTDLCKGQLVAYHGGTLYVVDYTADYYTNTSNVTSTAYDTASGNQLTSWQLDANNLPAMPSTIDIDPTSGNIYVCSDNGPLGYASNGYVYAYTANGTHIHTYGVGIHPYGVVFK